MNENIDLVIKDTFDEITLTGIFSLPTDIAFEIFREDKEGYCAICYESSISGEGIVIKSLKQFPHRPKAYVIDWIMKYKDMKGFTIKIYQYIGDIACTHSIGRNMIKDVTADLMHSALHVEYIRELLG